mgnify:CR=1 FL=1
MRLLIDVGNTQVKYVLQTSGLALSEIVYLDYQHFLAQLSQGEFSHVKQVVLANVHGDDIHDAIKSWASFNNIAFVHAQSQATAFGVISSYQQPERLGVDRWLAMIGAKLLYPNRNLLIIDAGTATTVDLLASSGQHCGGWIMPGVQTMFNSLLTRTQKIIATPSAHANLAFGIDSSTCLNHGSWAMTVGAVKEAIIQANSLLNLDEILLTGGNGEELAKLIVDNFQLEPKLVFYGLSCFKAL